MRRLAMLLLTAVALVGCGSASTQESAAAPADAAPSTGAAEPAARPSAVPADGDAPFGTVTAVGGGQIDGGDLVGRDLALWFWAPW